MAFCCVSSLSYCLCNIVVPMTSSYVFLYDMLCHVSLSDVSLQDQVEEEEKPKLSKKKMKKLSRLSVAELKQVSE